MMLTQDHKFDLQGWLTRLNRTARAVRRKATRNGRTWLFSGRHVATAALAVVAGLMLHPGLRQWAGHVLANVFILGGIVAAPVISIVGWIGTALPPRTALHEASSALFLGALIWLVLAIVAAHAHSRTWTRD
jgi:hypothetical protein